MDDDIIQLVASDTSVSQYVYKSNRQACLEATRNTTPSDRLCLFYKALSACVKPFHSGWCPSRYRTFRFAVVRGMRCVLVKTTGQSPDLPLPTQLNRTSSRGLKSVLPLMRRLVHVFKSICFVDIGICLGIAESRDLLDQPNLKSRCAMQRTGCRHGRVR